MRRDDFSYGVEVQKEKSGHIKNVPSDILLDIISRVPVEFVLECKLVCKSWIKLLHARKSLFTDMHISYQLNRLYGRDAAHGDDDKLDMGYLFGCTTDADARVSLFYGGHWDEKINTVEEHKKILKKVSHPPMNISTPQEYMVGSCNGLVCLGRHHHHSIDPTYIYNPTTREYLNLPKLIMRKGSNLPHIARGFGYVPSTNEYKVVRIFYPDLQVPGHIQLGQVQVYTLGSGCGWRNKRKPFPWVDSEAPASFVDGSLYWSHELKIYAFDLATEEMRKVPSPPCHNLNLGDTLGDHFGLVVLRRNLCFFHQTVNAPHMEIWSLKKGNAKERWCKDFSIVHGKKKQKLTLNLYWPLEIMKNNKILFTHDYDTIHCYDPMTTTWKEIVPDDPDVLVGCISVISHVNTFISLKALGGKSRTSRIKILR